MRLPRIVAPLIVAPLLLAGCGSTAAAPGAAPAVAATASSEFGGTDLAWVELMIPMDEQLLPVLDLVRQRSSDPRLTALAGELQGVYTGELPRLRAVSAQAGLPKDNPHAGHKMPGLVDADRLATLKTEPAAAFDKDAVDCLREHLTQLAQLAGSELSNGTSPTVKTIATQVQQTRTAAGTKLPA